MNWIKKNIVIITYILTVISDLLFKFTSELDLENSTLNIIKAVGAVVAVLLTQLQEIKNGNQKIEELKNEYSKY